MCMLRLVEGLGPTHHLLRFFKVTLPIGFFFDNNEGLHTAV